MKKIVKICLFSFLTVGFFCSALAGSYVAVNLIKFSSLPLNAEALSSSEMNISIFDRENKPIKQEFSGGSVKIEELSQNTKQAFLSIEDKDFYSHHGLNYKRMAAAMLKNIKSGRLKEGASTISQQLIKNTHLSSEKTLTRKLKEIALTKKLENQFSKDEILQDYLNVIFFGNNCYGLENASQFYYSKPANKLSLTEACTLAGVIKSPTKYSPISNPENCINRRNLVLSQMQEDGFLTEEELIQAKNTPLNLSVTQRSSKLNTYGQCATEEAASILGLTEKQLAIGGYKIHTYQDEKKEAQLKAALENMQVDGADSLAIAIDTKTCGITAYHGSSNFNLLHAKRQPASCLKPLLVYAPALNEGVISPETQILDEKITIGNYSPSNVNKKYSGYMSVTDAVKNSVNIPAIKCLSYIGIDTGKQYAEKLGIDFVDEDNSYALALGGMTYGVSLKDLASAYTVFPNAGEYQEAKFVEYITDSNGKLVYVRNSTPRTVFREDSAYLMTTTLQETAKTGTARKLSDVTNTEIAAKTGTVGTRNGGNTDAYTIAYTPNEVVGVWFGSTENQPTKIVGGNQPVQVAREYISVQNYSQTEFSCPSSVTEAKIDTLELDENHRLVLANKNCPERYTKSCLFSRFNIPDIVSENFSKPPEINADASVEEGQILLTINAQKHLNYQIYKNNMPCQKISGKSGQITLRLNFPEEECVLKIVGCYANDISLSSEKTFTLKQTSSRAKPKEKWYI